MEETAFFEAVRVPVMWLMNQGKERRYQLHCGCAKEGVVYG